MMNENCFCTRLKRLRTHNTRCYIIKNDQNQNFIKVLKLRTEHIRVKSRERVKKRKIA